MKSKYEDRTQTEGQFHRALLFRTIRTVQIEIKVRRKAISNSSDFRSFSNQSTYLMDEWEHGHCYFEPKEMEMGKLKYRTQKLFFHDHGTHAALPWMEGKAKMELGRVLVRDWGCDKLVISVSAEKIEREVKTFQLKKWRGTRFRFRVLLAWVDGNLCVRFRFCCPLFFHFSPVRQSSTRPKITSHYKNQSQPGPDMLGPDFFRVFLVRLILDFGSKIVFRILTFQASSARVF